MIYSHPERNATEKEGRYIQNWDLHGTRNLGQEVFTALQRADAGLGVIAGLSIAFCAIIADRSSNLTSKRIGARLGV
jgi:glycine betaine/proline transport system permease protein